jgi:hypothetical protein
LTQLRFVAVNYIFCIFFCVSAQQSVAQRLQQEVNDSSIPLRRIKAERASSNLVINGILDEEAWQKVSHKKCFMQWEPEFGKPSTEITRAAVLYNQRFIYIGILCYDSEPDKIISREMRRDADLMNDDSFHLVFDTFNDKRNGFYFSINPNGCRRDATFSDEGQSFNTEWDGIWQCETKINEKGWFAEVAIPWETLRFEPADSIVWGINAARIIRRKNEQVWWQLVPRDASDNGFFRVSQAGALDGLKHVRAGGNIELIPYILSSSTNDESTDFDFHNKNNWGFDSKISITSNTSVNFTWNTDFAQVEADDEQINLTRFSLYFPEKRDFFLDGAEIFNFGGQSISGGGFEPDNGIRLFYSRRMGIIDGYRQPIHNGVKMFGKFGKYQTGLINVLTNDVKVWDEEEEQYKHYKADNSTVFRLRRDLLKRSNIGMMFLNRELLNSGYYNRTLGIDANFPLSHSFTLSGSLAGTHGPDITDEDGLHKMDQHNLAGSVNASYDSDLWEIKLSHVSIASNFNAELGFVPRTDIKNTNSVFQYSPRSEKYNSVRKFGYRFEGSLLTDQGNSMLENRVAPVFWIEFKNGSTFFSGFDRTSIKIEEDWEVRPGYWIPTETYRGSNIFLFYRSDQSKDFSGSGLFIYGDYFTGKRFAFSPSLGINSVKRFSARINFNSNYISLPEGSFKAQTFGCRLYYYFSTRLYLKAFLQYNDDRLANEGNSISLANLLLRWTYRPGSDFYLVYNDSRYFGASDGLVKNRSLMLKATYFWRK